MIPPFPLMLSPDFSLYHSRFLPFRSSFLLISPSTAYDSPLFIHVFSYIFPLTLDSSLFVHVFSYIFPLTLTIHCFSFTLLLYFSSTAHDSLLFVHAPPILFLYRSRFTAFRSCFLLYYSSTAHDSLLFVHAFPYIFPLPLTIHCFSFTLSPIFFLYRSRFTAFRSRFPLYFSSTAHDSPLFVHVFP